MIVNANYYAMKSPTLLQKTEANGKQIRNYSHIAGLQYPKFVITTWLLTLSSEGMADYRKGYFYNLKRRKKECLKYKVAFILPSVFV